MQKHKYEKAIKVEDRTENIKTKFAVIARPLRSSNRAEMAHSKLVVRSSPLRASCLWK